MTTPSPEAAIGGSAIEQKKRERDRGETEAARNSLREALKRFFFKEFPFSVVLREKKSLAHSSALTRQNSVDFFGFVRTRSPRSSCLLHHKSAKPHAARRPAASKKRARVALQGASVASQKRENLATKKNQPLRSPASLSSNSLLLLLPAFSLSIAMADSWEDEAELVCRGRKKECAGEEREKKSDNFRSHCPVARSPFFFRFLSPQTRLFFLSLSRSHGLFFSF